MLAVLLLLVVEVGVTNVVIGFGLDQPGSFVYYFVNPTVLTVGLFFLPMAIGIALLRYRLYDIDVLINRALVYSVLTTTLALVYVGSIVLFQAVLRPFAGENNQLVTVVSTLLIAALFQPLRRRIQWSIDRRFYRRKYDAVRTLQGFSTQLRDEVELNMLTGDLLAVVEETLQPTHVSLWLRQPKGR